MNEPRMAVVVELKCPECGTIQEFVSMDFEDVVDCENCDYSNEAWFYPHRQAGTSGPYVKGDAYSNDSLMYPKQFNAQYQALVEFQSKQARPASAQPTEKTYGGDHHV